MIPACLTHTYGNLRLKNRRGALCGVILGMSLICTSCGGKNDVPAPEEDVLVMVGDSALTMRDVLVKIPRGLTPADSVMLFQSIVDGWLERSLLTSLAAEKLDNLEEIDRMVEDYRKKLIIASYRRKLRETYQDDVSKAEVDRYYKQHKSEMILERPVIKGIYMKIPSDAARISDVRKWMKSAAPDALDNLEQYGLAEAIEYSFFTDKWIDWDQIARQIPYRFDDPERFVTETEDFEITRRGITYLLHITDMIGVGELKPEEVAREEISDILSTERGEKYEERLIKSLYSQAAKSGLLKSVNYDPFKHRMKAVNPENESEN
ncbi:MAG: hypothetical protein K2M41_06615 [Muribaculaceae bacterium]|nr:hypothetical protein [Muribaculaceae bacterium]